MPSRPDGWHPPEGDWLAECAGFIVESDAGRIGRVAEVERDADSGRPVALVVRAGMAGWRRLVVPVDDVAGVLPGLDRIVLNSSWAPLGEEHAAPSPA